MGSGLRFLDSMLIFVRKMQTSWLRARSFCAKRRARMSSGRVLEGWPGNSVLIVCHGNIYRSAFVAEFLKQRLGGEIEIRSAGFHPVPGRSSPERHIELCTRFGVDLQWHRSSVIDERQIRDADLIVLMDRKNWVSLRRFNADVSKFAWLGAFADGDVEVPDPYGLEDAAAAAIVDRLYVCSEGLAKALQSKARARSLSS